ASYHLTLALPAYEQKDYQPNDQDRHRAEAEQRPTMPARHAPGKPSEKSKDTSDQPTDQADQPPDTAEQGSDQAEESSDQSNDKRKHEDANQDDKDGCKCF